MRFILLALLLAACATPLPAGDIPTREAVGAALRERMTCVDLDGITDCVAPPRRIAIGALRCRRVEAEGAATRLLCTFAGMLIHATGSSAMFGPECAWMSRDERGNWRIDSYPDQDVCDS